MIKHFFNCHHFMRILFIFQAIKFIFSEIKIDKMIILGGDKFKYSHFSFNANGDMIIDSSTYPVSKERRFFGLRNNGSYYFKESNINELGYYSISASHSSGRLEGESCIIQLTSSNSKFNGRELLCGISKSYGTTEYYFEIYNLESKNMSAYKNSAFFTGIMTDTFTFIKLPDESNSNFHYIITYIAEVSSNYYLYTRIVNFSFQNANGFKVIIEGKNFLVSGSKIISCFLTENLVYLCFYLNSEKNLRINVYKSDYSDTVGTTIFRPTSYNTNIFFKGILLKGEIGFFIFFKEPTSTYPVFSLMKYNNYLKMEVYKNFNNLLIK